MKLLLATLFATLVLIAPAQASIYVNTTGSDAPDHINTTTGLHDGGCYEGGGSSHACATPAHALTLVTNGQTVYCLPGSYPATTVTRAFTSATRLNGGSCQLAGLTTSSSAAFFTASGVDVAGPTALAGSNIVLSGTDHTSLGGTCIRIRGAHTATVTGATIHDCRRGIDSPYTGNSTPATASDDSTNVTVTLSSITNMSEDGIAIGDWTGVNITDNNLHHLWDPRRDDNTCPVEGCLHNDGIQFFGGVHDVQILRNTIDDSGTQGMLLQTAGAFIANTNMTVRGNTVTHARGVAFQADASGTLTIDANTFCGGEALTGGDANQALWVWSKVAGVNVSVTGNKTSMPWQVKGGTATFNIVVNSGNTSPCP